MANKSMLQFFSEVRQEVGKVTWPTRNETLRTTMTVLIMVAVISMFFFFVDSLIFAIIQKVLGF